ncbi:YciI family protein [Sphingomonas sp.]|uniref:YciI family protein n=1 Tax=Sphingomonas sp. TaxID=28214 RepID=UPI000DB27413|nr:YciI family protein [Sphingomonas sp.]PZU10774.1 MAG: hypothetical protein DI605_03790 [Sphingomonas sp.]
MPLFIVQITNKPGTKDARADALPDHHRYLRDRAGNVLIGGAILDESETGPTGSIYVIEAGSLNEARRFADDDPLTHAGTRGEIVVCPWRTALYDRRYVFGTAAAGDPIPGQAPPTT